MEHFLSPELPDSLPASGTQLLPGFDEYLLGYSDRRIALADEHSPRVFPGKNGMFLATVVVDGAVAGTWRRRTTSREVTVTAEPFESFPVRTTAQLQAAASDYARFLGLTLRMDA